MAPVTGFLLATPIKDGISRASISTKDEHNAREPHLEFRSRLYGLKQWEEYWLHCDARLADEGLNQKPPFQYRVICVRSNAKIIVLCERRRISEFVIHRIFHKYIFPNLRRVNFHIDKLIAACSSTDCEYLTTALHGRFSGSDRHLRSMSLYGNDVTSSTVYNQTEQYFNFVSCGVGMRAADDDEYFHLNDEHEIVKLSTEGHISINLTNKEKAKRLMRVVNFVIQNRWVDSWVPAVEHEEDYRDA